MSRFIRPASLLLTYGALLPSLAYAAEPAVEEVLVSASRTERPLSTIPNTVTVINPAELEQQLFPNALRAQSNHVDGVAQSLSEHIL